jgi:hypothetical protein
MLIYAWARTGREDLLPGWFDDIGGEGNKGTELLPTNIFPDR